MKNILIAIAFALFASPVFAQTPAKEKPASPDTKTENRVTVKDGKTFVVSTTINQVETTAEAVGQKVDQLRGQKDKMLADIAKLEENIRELLSLRYDLEKAEARLKRDKEPEKDKKD